MFIHFIGFTPLQEASVALSEKSPELHLDMVGDGPKRKNLEKMAEEQGLSDRLRFTDINKPNCEGILLGRISLA